MFWTNNEQVAEEQVAVASSRGQVPTEMKAICFSWLYPKSPTPCTYCWTTGSYIPSEFEKHKMFNRKNSCSYLVWNPKLSDQYPTHETWTIGQHCDDICWCLSVSRSVKLFRLVDYTILMVNLLRYVKLWDLGILLDIAVQQIAKANRMLVFVKRNVKLYDDPFVTNCK